MAPPPAAPGRFLDDFLPHLLARASQAVSEDFYAALRSQGITVPVWRVLAALSDSPGETVTALTATCLLQQPTMTKLLDRMERGGLIRRQADPRDRRLVRITLTSAGQAKAVDLVAQAKRHEADVLARYPQAAALKDLLRDISARPRRSRSAP